MIRLSTSSVPLLRGRALARPVGSTLRGYTLIEVLVTVTISSLVLTSVAVALTSLFRAEDGLRDQFASAAIEARLAIQLRSDAHRATTVASLPGDTAPNGFVLSGPTDLRIEYRTGAGRVTRSVFRGDKATQRDAFRLPKYGRASYEIAGPADRPAVSVLVRNDRPLGQQSWSTARDTRIVAAVGIDARLLP